MGEPDAFDNALEKVLAKAQMMDYCHDEYNEMEFEAAVRELKALYTAALQGNG